MNDTAPLPVIEHAIPAELKTRRQWVAWKQVVRGGKPTKVPINPDMGSFAQADAPSTWGTFEMARDRQRKDRLAGVGYMFSPTDPYCGIDFDKCRDPETGSLDPETRAMIGLLDSYTEVSPSGTGVKLIVRAALPGPRNRTTRIEMYDRLRYFTVTGHLLPGSAETIEDRQPQLAQLYRRVFGDRTFGDMTTHGGTAMAPGPVTIPDDPALPGDELWRWAYPRLSARLRRVADGDDTNYEGDASRGDAALIAALLGIGLLRGEVAAAFRASPRGEALSARKGDERIDYLIWRAVEGAIRVVGEAVIL